MKRLAPVLLAAFSLGLGAAAHAALLDSYGPRRVVSFSGSCPEGTIAPTDICLLTVVASRPLTATGLTEAQAAGLSADPRAEPPSRRTITRAQLTSLVTASSPAP